MRHHFLTALVATVLIGLVSGQFPFGNGFQSSSFASSSNGVQVSAGVNNFQSYNQAPPTNFNPNGRNGFSGTETQANSGGGVAINPSNPSNSFQQFPSPNVPVNPLSLPPVNAAASSSLFQQFPSANVLVNPLRIPPVNAAASSNSFQEFQNTNAPGNLLRVPPLNSAAANFFQQILNGNVPVNSLRVPPINTAVSSNAFQPFPDANIPAGVVPSVNTAVHLNDFQHNPSPVAPDLSIIKPPVQPFSMMPSNKGQMRNGANYPPPHIANPSNAFSPSHSSASLPSGIPNDYPKFPFPKDFLDDLIASLGAVKSKSNAEDASETMAASPKDLNIRNNKEIPKARKKNGNKKRNKKKSKDRHKVESKAKAKSNSKAKVIQPATSKQDITTNASADEIKAIITASGIVDRASASFVTSSVSPETFKDSAAESKTSISNIEAANVQDEEKSTEIETSATTETILITNSEISNTNSEKTSDSSVTKSTGKDETRSITATNAGVNILSTEAPKKPKVKAKKLKNKSKSKKNKKNRKANLSASNYETTQKSTTKDSTIYSSSIQAAAVQRETTNAADTTLETNDETNAGAKANIMDSFATRDFASSVSSKQEDITKVTESSFESDVKTSKSEEIQDKSLDTQTNTIESTSKVNEKLSSSTTSQYPKKKKSNKGKKGKNNSKRSNTSPTKRKTAQIQKTSASNDDTSNINFRKLDDYTSTPSATSLTQPQTTSEKKYVSTDLINEYVTDATTQVLSTDFSDSDNDDSKSEMISNNAMSSTLKTDTESDESKVDENSDTSKSISDSEISDKTTTGFENQAIPNDYPKFPFPKGFLDELFKSLETDRKSKSAEKATSETTPAVNETVNKGNKKPKSKPRKKHDPKIRNSKRKSKADRKNTEKVKSDEYSYSVEKTTAISTASSESKLDNPTNAVMDVGEIISITTASNAVDSFSVTESSNVKKETTESIDTATIPTTQAGVTNLNLDDTDFDTSKTKNPKATEAGETKIITVASTGESISSIESPKKTNLKARKPKSKSKSKSKNKKKVNTKLSTNKYVTTQKSTTKGSTSYASGIETKKIQGETTNSMDKETKEIDHTDAADSVTTNAMDSVLPNDVGSSATTKYQEEKRVTDTSNNKSDFITPKYEEKQMDSMVTETSKSGNKLRLSTAAPRKKKNRNRINKSKNNKKRSSTSASKNTTPLQEQGNPLNDDKINKNPGEASKFTPTLSVTTLTTTSYKSTDKTEGKKYTRKSETASDVVAKSSLYTERATSKSEIGGSGDSSKSVTDSTISSKTTVELQNHDAVPTTKRFIAEADAFTPTSDITAETDEGSSDSSGETQNTPEDTVLSGHKISTEVNNISNSGDNFSTIITEASVDTDETGKGSIEVTGMKTISTTDNDEISADKRMTTLKSKITPVEIEIITTMETITANMEEDTASETGTSSDLDAATDEAETSITPNELVESEKETTNEEIIATETTMTKEKITTSVNEITTPLNQEPVTTMKSSEREERIVKNEGKSTEDQTTVTKEEIITNENVVTTSVQEALFTVPSDTDKKITEKETIATKKEITTPQIEEVTHESKIFVTTNEPTEAEKKTIGNEEGTTEKESSTTKKVITTSQVEETSDENETSVTTTEQINSGEKTIKTEVTANEETGTTENEFTTSRYKATTRKSEKSITTNESIKTEQKSTKIGEETTNTENITSEIENTTPVNEHTTAKESTILVKKTTKIIDQVDTTNYKGTEKATDKTIVGTHIKSTTEKVTKPINIIATTEPVTMAAPKKGKTTAERETSTVKIEADVTKEESTETTEDESTLHTTYNYPFDYATETPPPGVECRKNERYYKCVPHCRHTCFNYDNYVVPCPTFCMPGCFCDPGLVVDENGDCVNISQCKNYTCGEDEEWWNCKPQYHNTCANFARAEARIDFECESGCFCRDGLIQDNDGSCVEIYDCSDPICEETEEATDCLNTCNTCEADCHSCTVTMCTQGCDCLDGYKRDVNGTCIHASKCPVCTSPSPVSDSTEG